MSDFRIIYTFVVCIYIILTNVIHEIFSSGLNSYAFLEFCLVFQIKGSSICDFHYLFAAHFYVKPLWDEYWLHISRNCNKSGLPLRLMSMAFPLWSLCRFSNLFSTDSVILEEADIYSMYRLCQQKSNYKDLLIKAKPFDNKLFN